MALTERLNAPAAEIDTSPLGELACGMLFALDVLTLEAPLKTETDFDSQREYRSYISKLRFNRGFERQQDRYGHVHLQINARDINVGDLRVVDSDVWRVTAHRTDTSNDLRGRYAPEAIDASYYIALGLWKAPVAEGQLPQEAIMINALLGAGFPPTLSYADNYPGVSSEITEVAPEKIVNTYQFDIVEAVTRELESQALALRYVNA